MGEREAAWIEADGDAGDDVIRTGGEVLNEAAGMRVNGLEHVRDVDDGNDFRAAAGDVEAGLVGSDGDGKGLRGVAFELVEWDFKRFADIGAEDGERVFKGAAVFEMGERDEVLGVIFGDCAETAVGGDCDVKDAGNSVERNAIDYDGAGDIDDGDFGFGGGAMGDGLG